MTRDRTRSSRRRLGFPTGLSPRYERAFRFLALGIAMIMFTGWVTSVVELRQQQQIRSGAAFGEGVAHGDVPLSAAVDAGVEPRAPAVTPRITQSLFRVDEAPLPFLTAAMARYRAPLTGHSGQLRAAFYLPGAEIGRFVIDDDFSVRFLSMDGVEVLTPAGRAPRMPGLYRMQFVRGRSVADLEDFVAIVQVPFDVKDNGRIDGYQLGVWPFENGGTPRTPAYANPPGFIEVTPRNRNVRISRHFRLGDFLTKGQANVWPKYMVLSPKLVDKLELVIDGLEDRSVGVETMKIMSGFRHPSYNAGGGNTGGRASLSRHMYGDAADVFVDNNGDNWSDDVTGDGRLTIRDAERIRDIVDEIERRYPSLIGGVGIYPACCGHGPMTHVDVRGNRARWYY